MLRMFVLSLLILAALFGGRLGYMFWTAECPSTRRVCTVITRWHVVLYSYHILRRAWLTKRNVAT
jgi:hypothetical protein